MKYPALIFFIIFIVALSGCTQAQDQGLDKVGVLLPHPVDDQGWNSKGYQGILRVQSSLDVEVLMKEDVRSKPDIEETVLSFVEDGAGLIIGHSHLYADVFMDLKDQFQDIHFVSFNGEVEGDNITSLHFDGYAMGYFAGVLAGEMSETGVTAVIAAFPFQPEVDGFAAGVVYQNPDNTVEIKYVNSWSDSEKAIEFFDAMKAEGADVFYPAGDGYHVEVVEEVKREGLYAIGYVGDQSDLGESTILTSTVQEVEKLYEYVAEAFNSGELETGNKYFDFADGVITLGGFSQDVSEETQVWLKDMVDHYIETGELPHQVKD